MDVRDVTDTVAARARPEAVGAVDPSSRTTPEGDIPCLRRVTPVKVVYVSLLSEVATNF